MSREEAGNEGNNTLPPPQPQDEQQPMMPTAPYPPMMSVRFPSAQFATVRSSLTSSPQYPASSSNYAGAAVGVSTVGVGSQFAHRHNSAGETSSSTMVASNVREGGGGADASSRWAAQQTTTKTTDSHMGNPAAAAAAAGAAKGGAGSSASTRPFTSRVQFCNTNMVACINCQEPTADGIAAAGGTPSSAVMADNTYNTAVQVPRAKRKLGPILLDLRQLVTVSPSAHHRTAIQGLFTTRTVALSRGNPSLGASVASTCLDVSSILPAAAVATHQSFQRGGGTSHNYHRPPPCATGLTTGALCIHTFSEKEDDAGGGSSFATSIEYFHTPRHHRQATAVSWRRHNSRHVAIGLVSSSAGTTPLPSNMNMNMNLNMNMNTRVRGGSSGPVAAAVRGGGGGGAGSGGGGGGGDREFCCFLWDIEHQAMGSSSVPSTTGGGPKRTMASPLFKLSHNSGVASLAWLLEGGQTLAVGGQQRNIQLYDLRVSGTSSATPPISAFGHNFGVHGIEVDPFRPHQFATFSRAAGESIKIWDARRMDAVVSEIKVSSMTGTSNADSTVTASSYVSSLRWSARETGVLSVAMGNVVLDYDTMSSRPVLSRVNRAKGPILDMALYPGTFPADSGPGSSETAPVPNAGFLSTTSQQLQTSQREIARATKRIHDDQLISELYPQRMLVVLADRSVQDMAKHTIAPLAISRRDGRVVHALGKDLFLGSTRTGPSAMESLSIQKDEDISATMMRRARCLHAARYSMDTASNIQVLTEEMSLHRFSPDHDALLRLWTWIDRIEALCTAPSAEEMGSQDDGGIFWASKGFDETGVWKLLKMGDDTQEASDENMRSDSLSCDLYDSPARRAALTACGWTGRFDLSIVLSECEALGEFERSAALAVFHGSLGSAVDALQRGADVIHRHMSDKASQALPATAPQYAETLQLVAMCVAGFGGVSGQSAASPVWRRACESLMRRPDMTGDNLRSSRTAYLRALCTFLINISLGRSYDELLDDSCLSLCDRVAFACRFLPRDQLKSYLLKRVEACQHSGNIEGLVITGIEKEGIKIVQSYVDLTADIQTAALVTSRVILPNDWASQRRVCAEFLDCYRTLLNTWQMWQSRAMFDVDRADLLRKIKVRQADAQLGNTKAAPFQSRRIQSRGRQSTRQPDPDIVPSVPAQLDARCTYCSASLGLKRLDTHANQWLSKMKPVLSCCPSCQKPLPRCAICLLSLGCLNPYMELTKERDRARPSRGGSTLPAPDDLSSLANLPFAEWFTWCMTCKHGGHAHHLVGWFANHEVCPVSGCDCKCQFDGIQKLNRPALNKPLAFSSHGLAQPAETLQ